MKGSNMLKSIKMAGLAVAVTLGGLWFSAPSFAQDVEFMIGPDGLRIRTREYCEDNPYDRRCREYRRDRYDDNGYGRRCDPEDAMDKARRMGVRRARVVDVDRRTIDVAGRWRGDRVILTFGRRGNCPLIRY
jgi:hypothetical protein